MGVLSGMKPLISVIIPCYNAQAYVDRCVESLVSQTIGVENLQLIFIDDASEDGTLEALCRYESKYPDSIVVISNEEHHCPGGARNIGMAYALADYIGYCDIDDHVEPDMYDLLYEQTLKHPYDIVYGKYVRAGTDINQASRKDCEYHFTAHNGLYWGKDEITDFGNNGFFGRMCWAGIYKKAFLTENDIFFPIDLIHEDIYWMELVSLHASSAYIVDRVVYHYEINPNSITDTRNDERILDRMSIEVMLLEEYIRRGALEVFKPQIAVDFIHRFYINTLHMLFTRFDKCPNVYGTMHDVIYEFFPDWSNYIAVGTQDAKVRFLLALLMKKESCSDEEMYAFQKAYLEIN